MTTQQRTTEADAGATPVACSLTPTDLAGQSARWERIAARALTERAETEHGLLLSVRPEPGAEEELRQLVAVENECCRWAKLDGGHARRTDRARRPLRRGRHLRPPQHVHRPAPLTPPLKAVPAIPTAASRPARAAAPRQARTSRPSRPSRLCGRQLGSACSHR